MAEHTYAVVMTTTDTKQSCDSICKKLLEDSLAACIQTIPINSTYLWEGKIQNDDEFLMLIKIKSDDFTDVEASIKAIHTYDTPEIIMLNIQDGNLDYLNWISQVTR